jgi:autotransporter-associated beta strand protein
MRRRLFSRPVFSAVLATLGATGGWVHAANTSSWRNAGTSWGSSANWIGGAPTLSQGAVLPAASTVVNPNIGSGTSSAEGLAVNNTASSTYSISPSLLNGVSLGTLVLGDTNYSQSGGGTTSLNVALRITAPTMFTLDSASRTIVAGRFYGGSATNSFTKAGAGTLQLDQDAPAASTTNMTVNVNAGVLEVRNPTSLGNAPNVIVNNTGVFQIDPALSYGAGGGTIGTMLFGNQNNNLTLLSGSTLRDGASGANASLEVALFGNVMIDNAATTSIVVPTGGQFAFAQSFLNSTAAPTGASSTVTISGAGVVTLNGDSGASNSFTGGYIIKHGNSGSLTGQTYVNAFDALGVSNAGYAAPVTLVSGFLTDVHSDITHPLPNPIALNGGVLNALASTQGVSRTDAYFSGTINIQALGGSTIDMRATNVANLAGPVCNINLTGPVIGNGLVFVTAPTTAPVNPGVLTLANTSPTNPNSESGNVVVQWNAALAATTSTGNSDPLGSATITLAGGELRLNHAGAGSGGTISAFAANSIVLRGYTNGAISTAPDHNGTITLGNASSANTGNTITLNNLTFDAGGTASNQTLTIQNATPGIGYSAAFNGTTTINGNATITTGSNPADVILNGKVTGSGNLIKTGNNTLTLNGVSSNYTGSTAVSAGTLVFGATYNIATFSISDGARATISPGANKVLKAAALSIMGSGTLNLTDEDAIFTGTSASTVQNLITTGYSHGAWNGPGIISSVAGSQTALGYATAQQIGTTSFDNLPVNSTDVIVRYTLAGDANLDGTVNSTDFAMMAQNFGKPTQTWFGGDFNYDGVVNALDFNAIASNFGSTLPSIALGTFVPEPVTIGLLAVPFVARRRRWFG